MRLSALSGLLLIGLAACQPRGLSLTEVPNAPAATCDARAEAKWSPDAARTYDVQAMAYGPACAHDIVVLAVRASDGAPVLAWAGRTADLFGLSDAGDAAGMKTALAAWIDQGSNNFTTASTLPPWPEGSEGPASESSEFPFHPEGWLDRAGWEHIRTGNAPLFAFPQGRESLAVFLLRDGQLEPIGVQQFPG
jgi:hypothetical protein